MGRLVRCPYRLFQPAPILCSVLRWKATFLSALEDALILLQRSWIWGDHPISFSCEVCHNIIAEVRITPPTRSRTLSTHDLLPVNSSTSPGGVMRTSFACVGDLRNRRCYAL